MTDQPNHDFDPLEAAFITAAAKQLPAAVSALRDFNKIADDLEQEEATFSKRARGAFSLASKLRSKEHTGLARKFESAKSALIAIDKTVATQIIERTQTRLSNSVLALQN